MRKDLSRLFFSFEQTANDFNPSCMSTPEEKIENLERKVVKYEEKLEKAESANDRQMMLDVRLITACRNDLAELRKLISARGVVLSPQSLSIVAKSILQALGYNDVTEIPYASSSSEGRTVPVPQPPGTWDNEYHFNSCMHAVFSSIFEDDLCLVVNSETTPWLEVNWNSKNDLKPDFFLFPSTLREFLSEDPVNSTYPTEGFYGKPFDNCAFLVDVVFEGKVGLGDITNENIGQLFRYLSAMSQIGSQHPRGLIYNSSEFIFAEYRGDRLIDVFKCRWDTVGSWKLLLSKIRPSDWNPMVNVLLTLKNSQGWTFERVLGRGRFGLVCEAVHYSNHYALKIVGSQVTEEFERLVDCHARSPDLVVAPTPNSFAIIGKGSYYTMNEIGIKMNPPARQVFLLLYELHQSGIIHGDPRIANVITLSDNALKWIDFRPQDSEVDLYHDLVTLVESVSLRAAKDMKVIQLMRRYGNSPCRENMTDVYNAVKEFMK